VQGEQQLLTFFEWIFGSDEKMKRGSNLRLALTSYLFSLCPSFSNKFKDVADLIYINKNKGTLQNKMTPPD